ncbi:phage repressor protein [Erwinia sp.]|uniref:phage repressor protein n=1 Tax=Erwinia citreus TaxID=558 RepID=UPI003C71D49D
MGFPSPAQDYVESRIDLNEIMVARPSSTSIYYEGDTLHVIDRSVRPKPGESFYYELLGESGLGRMMGGALVTSAGESIEGEVLDELNVIGRVMFCARQVYEERRPTI